MNNSLVEIELEEQNDLNTEYAKELKDFIKQFIKINCDNEKLLEGINGIFIRNEDLKRTNTLGMYNKFYKTIILLSKHINKFQSNPIFVLLHEMGHHHVEITEGIDREYDAENENKAYYREEIKANKFALKILEEMNALFDNKYKNLIRQVKLLINYLKDRLNGVKGFYFIYDNYQNNITITSITINGKPITDFCSEISIYDQLFLAC